MCPYAPPAVLGRPVFKCATVAQPEVGILINVSGCMAHIPDFMLRRHRSEGWHCAARATAPRPSCTTPAV